MIVVMAVEKHNSRCKAKKNREKGLQNKRHHLQLGQEVGFKAYNNVAPE